MALTKVTAGLITANAVVDSFGTQSITGDKIGLTAINANNIVDGTITGAKLAATTITGDKIGVGQITANLFAAGAVSATSIFNGTSNVSILSSDGAVSIGTNGTEALRVDTSQNVGIGTATPTTNVRTDIVSDNTAQQYVNVLKVKTTNVGDYHPAILFENNRNSISNAIKIALDSTTSSGSGALTVQTKDSGGTFNSRFTVTNSGILYFDSGYGSAAPAYGCRAWVNFQGSGTVTIRGSGNVSSITDGGDGNYTINFATAMPDTNYCTVLGGRSGAGTTNVQGYANLGGPSDTYTTSAVKVQFFRTDPDQLQEANTICAAIFR